MSQATTPTIIGGPPAIGELAHGQSPTGHGSSRVPANIGSGAQNHTGRLSIGRQC